MGESMQWDKYMHFWRKMDYDIVVIKRFLSRIESWIEPLLMLLKISHFVHIKTYWPARGGREQNPENTAQGNSVQNPICP